MNWVNCKNIIDVRDGTHDSPKYVTKGYPLITSKNISLNEINFTNVNYITKDDYDSINKRSAVSNGDILMPMIGTVGNPVIVNTDKDFAIKNVALFKKSENVDTKYLYYILISDIVKKQFEIIKRGGTQKFVSLKNIRNLQIPLPPLPTQRKIVEVLDKAQSLIDKRKEQIKLLDDLIQSTFYDMFGDPVKNDMGWEVRKLIDACIKKGEYGSGSSAINYSTSLPRYIRITDINDDGTLNDDYKSPSNKDDYEKYKLSENDLLFARSGATVGKTYLHNNKHANCVYAGYLIRFIPDQNIINPVYLFKFTKTSYYYGWIQNQQKAVAQPNINAKQYGNELKIFVPPLELQNQFAQKVEKIEQQKALLNKSLKLMEDNFNSLMQRAFRGEIV